MYSFNLENIVQIRRIGLFNAKAITDESNKWHRRLGHVNFKNLNKLVKGNLVRGLPSKIFQNDHTCVAFQKGKQHKASCKAKTIENQVNQKVKTIRCDNGTEFKNRDVIEFCGSKGIKREYSNARTPQQNGVAERKNRTLIEAARTMLADSFLPNTFWAEAVSTACYVLNRAFGVYNLETKRVEENLHINFLENKPNIAGKEPTWLFDLDYLTDSMNYHPVRSENQANLHAGQQEANQNTGQQEANQNAGTEDIIDAGDSEKEDGSAQDSFVLPIWPSYSSPITLALKSDDKREGPREEEQVFMDELERLKRQEKEANKEAEALRKKFETLVIQEGATKTSSTNIFSTVSTPAKASSTNLVNTVSIPVSTASPHKGLSLSDLTNPEEDDSEIPPLEDIYQHSTKGIFTTSSYDDDGAVADFTNPYNHVVNFQTKANYNKSSGASFFVSYVQKQREIIKGLPALLLLVSCLNMNTKKISDALKDESWLRLMPSKNCFVVLDTEVWVIVDLPYGKKAIGTKWVYQNKKDEREFVDRNKARTASTPNETQEALDKDDEASGCG
ncbi:putative ribonuclease H-like domain-containing protein [Tanacetum coccineum]|uniref:Ribonuclease H-like domain-containing protein n=1 Tax=Tanacetum coccineum TaxID=301880 RepID=A0ABQ5IHJ3_9ASTR